MTIINYAEAINDLALTISDMAEGKGFWDPDDVGDRGIIPLKLALIHSEATEALDVHRNEYDDSKEDNLTGLTEMQEEDFIKELADIIIRTFDLAGYFDLDIGSAVINKIEENRDRPYRHGKRY